MADVDMEELVFDPDQDLEEKRNLRQNYRKLASKIEEFQANPASLGIDQLREQIDTADKLFDKVMGPSEATLDSHFLLMASNMGAQKARAMKSGTGSFDVDEFIIKLRNFMGGGLKSETVPDGETRMSLNTTWKPRNLTGIALEDWHWLKAGVLLPSPLCPFHSPFLELGLLKRVSRLGPLSIEQKARVNKQRAKQSKNDYKEEKPSDIKNEDLEQSNNETTKNVAIVQGHLEHYGKVNFFRFVINPHDFAQTVENIFHLSFLIRDGKVAWEIEDAEPFVYCCDPPTDEDFAGGLTKQQLIVEFDEELWQDAIKTYNITESMIPQRPKEKAPQGNKKWYG